MFVTEEPWGFLLRQQGEGQALAVRQGDNTPALFCREGDTPDLETPYGQPMRLGFPFSWKGQSYQAWHLPTPNKKTHVLTEFSISAKIGGDTVRITQDGITPRPSVQHALPESEALDLLVRWMSHGFQELAHDKIEDDHAKLPGQVRRTWADANEIWLKPNLKEPQMELIIRLAQDASLRDKLESIARSPRRILTRIRVQTPVGRIQEMDAICIRKYAEKPGRTAMEKAGDKQRLLAVQRQTSHDTLENRVAVWVLEAIASRATKWVAINAKRLNSGSRRALAVKRFSKKALQWRQGEALAEVSAAALSHRVQANYPLMLDHQRYKRIYAAYLELLKYHRVEDDAWMWRRVLWSETVKQLVACAFNENWGKTALASRPYYRVEPDRGSWIGSHPTPGPYEHPKFGPMVLLDAREAQGMEWAKAAPTAWMKHVGVLGCDSIIWWPKRGAASVIWSNLAPKGNAAQWKASLDRAAHALMRFKMAMAAEKVAIVNLSGLVVQTGRVGNGVPSVELESLTAGGCCVVGLSIPQEVNQANEPQFEKVVQDFHVGVGLAMDHANG
jgi:hypothetical protein